jgi:DNA-binding NarL/FixJ family response regulator
MKPRRKIRIAILDDHYLYGSFIQTRLHNHLQRMWFVGSIDLTIHVYTSPVDFLRNSADGIDIAVIDYMLDNNYNGISVMEELLEDSPTCYVILISAINNINTSLLSVLKGAQMFIQKDANTLHNICYTVESIISDKIT